MDVLNEFRYKVHYIPGEVNVLADALSRLYSDEPAGIVRATSEYVGKDGSNDEHEDEGVDILRPVYTGAAAILESQPRRSAHLAERPVPEGAYRALHQGTAGRARRKEPQSKTGLPNPWRPRTTVEDEVSTEDASLKDEGRPTRSSPSMISTAGDIGMQLPSGFRGRYSEDSYFRKIVSSPSDHPLFEYSDGLLYKKQGDTYLLCVPDILSGSRRVREILIRHTHSILAHLGYRKTLDALRAEVWWPEMVADTEAYCRTCGICATTKSVPAKPMGMLRPLPVPRRPWQYIALDFVGPLPLSKNRLGEFDMICVIIDQLTSMVHIVPTKQTYGAAEMAEVIFEHVYKLHGLPERIISDCDSLFTSIFWRTLHGMLGTELRLSSSFHPQTDGATERANRTMTQMLRQCV